MRRLRGVKLLITGVVATSIIFSLGMVNASSANTSKSYQATTAIPLGSLVSLSTNKPEFVEPATTVNSAKLLGIVVEASDSLIAVDSQPEKLQIAISGVASVLVSNLNGDIKVGDQISASPFEGIGMRQTTGGKSIGLAQSTFDAKTQGVITREVKDEAGNTKSLRVGYARVNITPAGEVKSSADQARDQLNGLQKLSSSLTGKPVSTWRVTLSIIVVTIAFMALITLTYGAIYGSIISVGRNPLGAPAVFHTLRSILAMALVTASVAGVTVFFLLR